VDSLSQIALGSAVAVAALGPRTAVWKAAAWGAVAGTLPDLDVLIDHGDPVLNMVLHRAETHSPFWLTLFSLPFAALVARLHGEMAIWRWWWLAMWLALVTHPLLDGMTVYGTQLALPFSDHPYGVGSVFIIDPLYTLPLIVGVVAVLRRRSAAWNAAGLFLSTAYLAWGAWVQAQVTEVARASLAAQGIAADRVLVTPTAFNTVLWRVVAMEPARDGRPAAFHEGFRSLLDDTPGMHFDRFDQGLQWMPALQGVDGVRRISAFSHGFFKLESDGPHLRITDLRMGQEPAYTFSFVVAQRSQGTADAPKVSEPVLSGDGAVAVSPVVPSRQVGMRIDIARGLAWMWDRAAGRPIPPPR
jgi:inner membrane protein